MLIENLQLQIDTESVAWQETGVPGIRICPLSPAEIVRGAAGPVDATVLIRMEPGHGYPSHKHLGVEQVLILAGGYRDERGEHPTGSYLRYEEGSVHSPVALGQAGECASARNPACVLFAFSQGGIEPA